MPRFTLKRFVSKHNSSNIEDLSPQAEWEGKQKSGKKPSKDELMSQSSFIGSITDFPNLSESSKLELSRILGTGSVEEAITNFSGSFDGPECLPLTSTPKLDKNMSQGDSGYSEIEKPKTSQAIDALSSKTSSIQKPSQRPCSAGGTDTLTRVKSNSSRLDQLTHSKARLLYLNENMTVRSLRPEENVEEITQMCDIVRQGVTIEDLLKNFGRLPMDQIHHFAMVGEYLRTLHVESRMVDVLIHVGNQTFAAHRVALACHSQYFADMFSKHDENTKLPVEMSLSGIGALAFQAFLRYVYTGEMIMNAESVADVMAMGQRLSIPQISDICSEFIDTIPIEQAMAMLSSKSVVRGTPIFKHAYNLVANNFPDVFDCEHFLTLNLDLLCMLLSDDDLYIHTEMDVFWAGLKWVAYHITERHNHVSRVMKCVRFSLLPKRELFQCFEVTDLLRKSPACREMILCATWIITADDLGRPDPLNLPRAKPRNCFGEGYNPKSDRTYKNAMQEAISEQPEVVNRLLPAEDGCKEFEQYQRPDSPVSCGSLNNSAVPSQPGGMDTMPGDILAIGGFNMADKDKDGGSLKDVERYSSSENQWKYYTGLPEPRQYHAVAMLGNILYLVGGSDPKKHKKSPAATNTAFMFDPSKGIWSKMSSLGTNRMNHGLCSLYGMLYAIGGQDEKNRVLKSVECYNLSSATWRPVKDLITARCNFGTTVCKGRIYVAGGYAAPLDKKLNMPALCKFECFDPKFNSWTALCPMSMPRCLCNLVSVGGEIYLCGGATRSNIKEEIRSVAGIEVYDVLNDTWHYKTDLIQSRHNAGATVIGTKIYIIGGMSSINNQTLKSIECYDTRTECWDTNIQDLPYPAKWLGCVALPASK